MSLIPITIDDIEITSNARFYKLNKSLTKKIIKDTFDKICTIREGKGKRISHLRDNKRNKDEFISCLFFYTEKKPPFIKKLNIIEIKYSYLLIIEVDNTLVVSSLNVPNIDKYLKAYIEDFGYEVVSNTFSDESPKFEKIRLQSTSIMHNGIRKRTLEGNGLENFSFGHSSIPLSLTLRTDDNSKNSITLSTSRITTNNGRESIRVFLDWSKKIIYGLKNTTVNKFIDTFAKPVTLETIKKEKLIPSAILLNLYIIEDLIFDNSNSNFRIAKKDVNDLWEDIDKKQLKEIFDQSRAPLLVKKRDTTFYVEFGDYKCNIKILKNKINLYFPCFNSFKIIDSNNIEISPVLNVINENQSFTIVFDKPEYIYTKKELFLKKNIFENIEAIYNIIITESEINNCKAEKSLTNKFKKSDTSFHKNTLFGIVENNIWNQEGHLICDDLGDEWADHIVLKNSKDEKIQPTIEFYLSKHGDDTTSASKFHDVIGQANKNIGSIHFDEESIKAKIVLWKSKNYENTKIKKLRSPSSTWQLVESDAIKIIKNPLTIRKMYLVVSFLSKEQLIEDIKAFLTGSKNKKHIPQLIWFILAYINQSKENYIEPYIICKP